MSIAGDRLNYDLMHGLYSEPESVKDYIAENKELKLEIYRLNKLITYYKQKESDRSWSDSTQMERY